jgi:hypothetical protein
MVSNAELDRFIAELASHPLAEDELRELKKGVFVSLKQSTGKVSNMHSA